MGMTKHWLAAAAMALTLLGCSGGGSSGTPDPMPPPPPAPTGTVSGKVFNVAGNAPIAGVDVSAGTVKAKSAADGSFTLAGVAPAARVVVNANAQGYAPSAAIAQVTANQISSVRLVLTPVGVTASVAVATGGLVAVPNSTAQVQLPAGALVDAASGAAASGTVSVQLTPIDPSRDSAAMPGDYLAQPATGTTLAPIESFGALKVDIKDAAGKRLNLAPNQTATIRIPLSSRSADAPATIPLFYFDEAKGVWIEDGTAALKGSGAGRYYEGTVKHFTFWNADKVQDTIIVRGCVADAANTQLAGVSVQTDGLDYTGSAFGVTNASGEFEVAMRRGSVASLYGSLGERLTNVVVVGPSQTDIRVTECLRLNAVGVLTPPIIVRQPQAVSVTVDDLAIFSVQAIGSPVLQYQWRRNGQPIAGQTYPYLYLVAAGADNGAVYSVVVSNAAGSATSDNATLTVTGAQAAAPIITVPPQAQSVIAGQTATFAVAAAGNPAPTFQWRRNGVDIAGATAAQYTTAATTLADNGAVYTVVVSNSAGSVTSAGAILTVAASAVAPTITTQPAALTAAEGTTAAFTVTATGTGPLQYQWRRGGTPISGATSAAYITPTLSASDNGASFDVVVSNTVGSVTSAAATLTVTPNNTAQQAALVRLAFLAFDYGGLAQASFEMLDDNLAFLSSAAVCTADGSVAATLNGAAIVPGAQLPAGNNTLAATFTDCGVFADTKYTGTSSSQYNFAFTSGGYSGTGTGTMSNMRRVTLVGAGSTTVESDILGNGSVGFTASKTTAGAQVTNEVTISPNAGATLRNAVSGLTASSVSGSLNIRIVETPQANGVTLPQLIRYVANAQTFTVDSKTYVSQGTLELNFSGNAIAATGAINVTENGTQIGRIFADAQGMIQIEVNGQIIPLARPAAAFRGR